jgi:hypothetical protein
MDVLGFSQPVAERWSTGAPLEATAGILLFQSSIAESPRLSLNENPKLHSEMYYFCAFLKHRELSRLTK